MNSFESSVQASGRFAGYDVSIDPSVTSEFAAAAFRLHSSIPPVLALRNADNSRAGMKRLRDSYFQPFDLYQGSYFTKCAAGMAGAIWDKMDSHFTEDVQNHLFKSATDPVGLDLPAIDIQRGRDHGLQPYVKYRDLCQLRVPKSFDDLHRMDIMSSEVVGRLQSVYA